MGVTVVDSSVWIDLLLDRRTVQQRHARDLLDRKQALAIGDLTLVEVLQGSRSEQSAAAVQGFFAQFVPLTIVDHAVAVQAARFYRLLRTRGITIRKTIDTLIATRCIADDLPLLYRDRDFDPFVEHCGLRSALHDLKAS